MHLDRRNVLGGLAATPLAAMLPARHSPRRPASTTGTTSQSTTEFKGLERVMALFKQKYPDISVTQENIPNPEYMSKMTAAVVANAKPDTCMVVAERANDLVAMGGLIDLTDRIKAWPRYGEYPAQAWAGSTVNGKIYGIPAFTFVDWMYYRKDWFAEKGIAPPKTYQEFLEAAIKLSDPSKNRYGLSLRGGAGGFKYVLDLIESWGSPIVKDGKMAIDKKKAVEAVDFYAEHPDQAQGCAPRARRTMATGRSWKPSRPGQTAMVWHHTGSLTEIQAALKPEQFGTAAHAGRPGGAHRAADLPLQRHLEPGEDGCRHGMDLVLGGAGARHRVPRGDGLFPVLPQGASDERITKNPLYAAAVETTKFGRLPPTFVGVAGWSETVVLPEFQKVLVGRATAEQAVDAMMSGLEAALK